MTQKKMFDDPDDTKEIDELVDMLTRKPNDAHIRQMVIDELSDIGVFPEDFEYPPLDSDEVDELEDILKVVRRYGKKMPELLGMVWSGYKADIVDIEYTPEEDEDGNLDWDTAMDNGDVSSREVEYDTLEDARELGYNSWEEVEYIKQASYPARIRLHSTLDTINYNTGAAGDQHISLERADGKSFTRREVDYIKSKYGVRNVYGFDD